MTQRAARSARASIAEAALEMVGAAELDDLVRLLTPERLASVGHWAPSTVRYHFGGRSADGGPRDLGFRRRELALEILRLAMERAERETDEAVARWGDVVARTTGPVALERLAELMGDGLATFVPGDGDGADASSARDRVHYLALAVADDDPELARLLRESRARQIDAWTPALDAYIEASRRRLRPGRTTGDLVDALFAFGDGHLMRLRIQPTSAPEWLAGLLRAVLDAFTLPVVAR